MSAKIYSFGHSVIVDHKVDEMDLAHIFLVSEIYHLVISLIIV